MVLLEVSLIILRGWSSPICWQFDQLH